MHAISSYRVDRHRPPARHKHTQTGPIRLHYTTPLASAQCNDITRTSACRYGRARVSRVSELQTATRVDEAPGDWHTSAIACSRISNRTSVNSYTTAPSPSCCLFRSSIDRSIPTAESNGRVACLSPVSFVADWDWATASASLRH